MHSIKLHTKKSEFGIALTANIIELFPIKDAESTNQSFYVKKNAIIWPIS